MSLEAITWAWTAKVTPTQKLVLLALANHANPQWLCWPSLSYIEERTGLNRTTIWRTVDALQKAGFVQRVQADRPSTTYRLMQVQAAPRCTEHLGAQSNKLGAPGNTARCTVHPEPVLNHQNLNPSPSERGTRLSPDWAPPPADIAYCLANRPDLDPSAAAEAFRDYWTAQAGERGRKTDWSATWRHWIRTEKKRGGINHAARQQIDNSAPARVARACAARERRSAEHQHHGAPMGQDGEDLRPPLDVEFRRIR